MREALVFFFPDRFWSLIFVGLLTSENVEKKKTRKGDPKTKNKSQKHGRVVTGFPIVLCTVRPQRLGIWSTWRLLLCQAQVFFEIFFTLSRRNKLELTWMS